MGKVKVIGSWQGFFLGTAAFIGKMPNTLTLLGAFCILIASVAGYEINVNFGTTSFLVFILLSRAASVSPALKRKAIAVADPGPAPRYFFTKLRSGGPKMFFWRVRMTALTSPHPLDSPLYCVDGKVKENSFSTVSLNTITDDVKTRQESCSLNSVFKTSLFSFSGHELVQYGMQGSGTSTSPSRAQQRRRDWAQGQEQQQRQPSDYDVSHFFNG